MADINISKFTTQVLRVGSTPSSPGFAVDEGQDPVDPSGNPQTHLPVTIAAAADALSITDAQVLSGAGTTAQYVRGDGSLASFPSLTGFVPYTGASADVNLGTHDLTAERGTFANNGSSDTLTVNHTSGSGYGIIVTKGGNNEALYVSKTSGSGNAMTVVGGRTSLVDLALSSVTNTAGDFLTLSGGVVHKRTAAEVRTDIGAGTVTSVAALTLGTSGTDLSSTVANGTTTPVITLNVPTASATNRGALSSADWTTFNSKQQALNGTGFVKASGTTISYDNTSYLPLTGGALTGPLTSSSNAIFKNTSGFSLKLDSSSSTEENDLRFAKGGVDFGAIQTNGTTGDFEFYVNIDGTGGGYKQSIIIKRDSTKIDFLISDSINTTINSSGLTSLAFIKTGGTSAQFLKADGSVSTLTNPVTGTGTTNYLPKFTDSTSIGDSNLINNTAGNLGLAVTPSSWSSGARAFQIGARMSLYYDSFNNALFANNMFFDGTNNIYINTAAVGRFYIENTGAFIWNQSPSGTAGTAVSFTVPMTLFASGNLLIGSGSDAGFKLDVNGTGRFSNKITSSVGNNAQILTTQGATTGYQFLDIVNTSGRLVIAQEGMTAGTVFIGTTAYASAIGTAVSKDFQIGTNNTIRLTIAAATGAATFSSSVSVNGSFSTPHTTKSANYTLTASDYTVGFDCASNRTANLPDATTCAGRIYVIYQYNTNLGIRYVTLDGNGSQTINGITTYPLQSYGDFSSVMIQSTGSNWVVISDALYFIPL
jgi:hypothetical protein